MRQEVADELVDITRLILPYALVRRHAAWSVDRFGTNAERGPVGPLMHLAKEAQEAAEAVVPVNTSGYPAFVEEMADCMFLFLDALRRGGISNTDLVTAMEMKMPVLEARTYVADTEKPQAPVEHDRSTPDGLGLPKRTKAIRSVSPRGFARAIFEANFPVAQTLNRS